MAIEQVKGIHVYCNYGIDIIGDSSMTLNCMHNSFLQSVLAVGRYLTLYHTILRQRQYACKFKYAGNHIEYNIIHMYRNRIDYSGIVILVDGKPTNKL